MKKVIRSSVTPHTIFDESYKDEIYLSLGYSNPDWDKFFRDNLQDYCNEVLDQFDLWSDINFASTPMKVVFYDTNTDEEVLKVNFRRYSEEISDIYLDPYTIGPKEFKAKLRSYYKKLLNNEGII